MAIPAQNQLSLQRGVSLVELMVTIVVALLLLGGVIQVYLSNKQSYNAQEQLARMQESGRFAMALVTTDLRRSGYWGGTVALPLITGGADPEHTCVVGDTSWGRMVRWKVSGINNNENLTADYGCATDYDGESDILVMRYAGPNPIEAATDDDGAIVLGVLEAGRLYLRDNTESGAVVTGATADANTPAAVSGDDVRDLVRPMVSNAYYVGDTGRTCPGGQSIPALMRVRLAADGTPAEPEEIASGVERFEALYLLNGQYQNAGAIDLADGWLDVSAVRVWMLVRGECPEQGLQDTTIYEMGGETYGPANDNYRRQLYISTVMLRNTVVGDVVN